jgi:hypothetical protein
LLLINTFSKDKGGFMGFLIYVPIDGYLPQEYKTTNDLTDQILQEFECLRYIKKNAYSQKTITSCIDQAIIYYRDAIKVNWRSSGLLYYYSFLNFAKAYIAAKKTIRSTSLNTTSLLHGITAKSTQNVSNIMDYEIRICPPATNGSINIFSSFYESVTKMKWPFTHDIFIKISEIIKYSEDISAELFSLFHLMSATVEMRSILIDDGSSMWLDFLVPNNTESLFTNQINQMPLSIVKYNNLEAIEKNNWIISYPQITGTSIVWVILKSEKLQYSAETRKRKISDLQSKGIQHFGNNYIPIVTKTESNSQWLFCSDLSTNSTNIKWHPLFSNYLIAFALSSILRYQPHLIDNEAKSGFIMKAWCNQSAIRTLQYLLTIFTSPSVRVIKF